jgi:hydrogenase maturation protein HypF
LNHSIVAQSSKNIWEIKTLQPQKSKFDFYIKKALKHLFPKKGFQVNNLRQYLHLITLNGHVQGVGFRPFIKRLADHFSLNGYVRNQGGSVEIVINATLAQCEQFIHAIQSQAPPRAVITELHVETAKFEQQFDSFEILVSESATACLSAITPDFFCCADCLRELMDSTSRYFRYPFISCTQCGPRYTVQSALPYDRERTTLRHFPLCVDCLSSYQHPNDRRFHAETTACATCGPQIFFKQKEQVFTAEAALCAAVDRLKQGLIVAIQGIGGYHLCCLADNQAAVARLRQKKHRPDKPLAVLFKDLGQAEKVLDLTPVEAAYLNDIARPIVLARLKNHAPLAANLAPGLHQLGAFLAYSPLQHLLLEALGKPIVATSGNKSGQPVFFRTEAADIGLEAIADAFLSHNRPILRPADDSVLQVIDEKAAFIRLGRGLTPKVLSLPYPVAAPTFACGSLLKAAPALAVGKEAVLFPHLGDIEDLTAQQLLQSLSAELPALYGYVPAVFLADAHPDYPLRPWLERQEKDVFYIFHHHAHASALAQEQPQIENWLLLTWDGLGFGQDEGDPCQLWGGEFFIGKPGSWQRVASIVPLTLLGEAGRDPWRSAAALAWQSGADLSTVAQYIQGDAKLFYHAWQQNFHCHTSSAIGRLFDGMACLLGMRNTASYEGQAAMELETLAEKSLFYQKFFENPTAYFIEQLTWPRRWQTTVNLHRLDWRGWFPLSGQAADLAFVFHCTLAMAVADVVDLLSANTSIEAVGGSGGVWQNKLLYHLVKVLMEAKNLPFFIPQHTPANDGQIAYGQLVEWSARQGG